MEFIEFKIKFPFCPLRLTFFGFSEKMRRFCPFCPLCQVHSNHYYLKTKFYAFLRLKLNGLSELAAETGKITLLEISNFIFEFIQMGNTTVKSHLTKNKIIFSNCNYS
jgi:hypothetical protein